MNSHTSPRKEDDAGSEYEHAELTTFQCREAYVYRIPPATTIGHRAELWRVDDWDAEVAVAVVTCQEECWVRLLDKASGELFAECPIPQSQPLVTVVEPVVDSSRYYVLRIEDRASRRHAFIGFGFRERSDASNFNAALDDHLQHLRRKKAADAMRQQYLQARMARESDAASSDDGSSSKDDGRGLLMSNLSLKPGETISVNLPARALSGGGQTPPGQRLADVAAQARASFVSPSPLKPGREGSAVGGLLPPPPKRPTFSPRDQSSGNEPGPTSGTDQSSLPIAEAASKPMFRPFEDDGCIATTASPAKGAPSIMRASLSLQEPYESASVAALSLNSVGSGGSSLVTPSSYCPSEAGSNTAPSTIESTAAAVPSSNALAQSISDSNGKLPSAEGHDLSEVQRTDATDVTDADKGGAADWGDFVAS